jgi:hypothetical protein
LQDQKVTKNLGFLKIAKNRRAILVGRNGQKDKINLFLQGEIYVGYYKEIQTENSGNKDEYWSKYVIPQVRFGVKKNILRSGKD